LKPCGEWYVVVAMRMATGEGAVGLLEAY
jgi:hypothetical protein